MKFSSEHILETEIGDLSIHEDVANNCLHIWFEYDKKPVITVTDENHITIFPTKKGGNA